jgi:ATP-dependent helicase HrpB
MFPTLPINEVLDTLKQQLSSHRAVVLEAPPGAGKTTCVPLALLQESWLTGKTIVMLEPRRLAARAAACRMADLLGEPVGQTVGYRVRFDSQVSAATRIEVVTEGILARRIQDDPSLEGVGLVIFDEFHERHLHTDWGLTLCMDVMESLREDLKVLVMSATLDMGPVAKLLWDAPRIESRGRSYPVTIKHIADPSPRDYVKTCVDVTLRALHETSGDGLLFLPGAGEIRQCIELLQARLDSQKFVLHALYGDLPRDKQQRALQPDTQGRRKIVVATPIAESSLTIDGVRFVVDAGYCRVARFDPNTGLSQLVREQISRASAEQRAGRAGRQGEGWCYRLWSEATHRQLPLFSDPEISAVDLAPLLLDMAMWGVQEVNQLPWLTVPPSAHVSQAQDMLRMLGALNEQMRITPLGKKITRYACHPRLAAMLAYTRETSQAALAADIAALLSERDLLVGDDAASWDLGFRVEALLAFRRDGRDGARRFGANADACAWVEQASRHWRAQLGNVSACTGYENDDIATLLCKAYPERIARKRSGEGDRYLLANGRGARLAPKHQGTGREFLVCSNVDSGSEGVIRVAAPISQAALESVCAERIQTSDDVSWDDQREQVLAQRIRRMDSVVLEAKPLQPVPRMAAATCLVAAIRKRGIEYLPWDEAAREWQTRLLCLAAWQPEAGWPKVDDETLLLTLETWLQPYVEGITSAVGLARMNLLEILQHLLPWDKQQRFQEAAPTHITLPNGRRGRVSYQVGEIPVLAARVQDFFGMKETPRIAHGRVAVVIHMLSPAMRPVQVTQDLAGFWRGSYAEVRKEMKGRYPKHSWPEDPSQPVPAKQSER